MSNILRVLITVFIIGLVVMAIVFFSIFGMVPVEKLTKALKGDVATSTDGGKTIIVSTTTIVERVIERVVPPEEEPEDSQPPPPPSKPPKFEDKYKYALRISEGRFSPTTVAVDKGEEVIIGLKSDDEEYTIKILEYGLSQTISKGEEKIIAFQALSAGDFNIVCEGCDEGFKATLIVE